MHTLTKIFMFYMKWLPLVVTSLVHKVGVIMIILQYFGYLYAIIALFSMFIMNFLSTFLLTNYNRRKSRVYNIKQTNRHVFTVQEFPAYDGVVEIGKFDKLYLSYSNMFVISGPLKEDR